MPTDCSAERFAFAPVDGRAVVAAFDGGTITSDAGALLLGATDRAIGLVRRFAACFVDQRSAEQVEHTLRPWSGNACSRWRWAMRIWSTTTPCATTRCWPRSPASSAPADPAAPPLAGKSTLNRLEHAPAGAATRYHKVGHDGAAIERLFVDLFLDAHRAPPRRSCSIWTRRTIRSTAPRRVASFMATMAVIATCRSTSSAAISCWPPSCGGRTSTPAPAQSRRSSGSLARSAPAGPACGSSCAPIRASPARR